MELRALTEFDLKLYKNQRLNSLTEAPYSFSDRYNDIVQQSDSFFLNELGINQDEQFVLGAFDNETNLIGFVRFIRDLREKARHKAMIHVMYVHPQIRNQSIGEKLLSEVFELSSKMIGLE